MKKIVLASVAALSLMLAGCGKPLNVGEKEYPTYGFLNEDSNKSDQLCYEVSIGNIVWSVLLIHTVVAPIYFIGFSIFNPVGVKNAEGKCGVDAA
jgi:hypothetical protein